MSIRIAFLTNEFVTEKNSRGLGSYLDRITQTLKHMGHEPEVFVTRLDGDTAEFVDRNGVRVQRIPINRNRLLRCVEFLEQRILNNPWAGVAEYLGTSLALSPAFERRHAEKPFEFVQSVNCAASGLFVRKIPGRPHLVRMSSHRDLWWQVDGQDGLSAKIMIWLERACVRRADIAYAPSRFLAEYCRLSGWRNDVHVVRPPIFQETKAQPELIAGLPDRYLLHFGRIGVRKGSDLVASALMRIWQQVPDFRMVWAGAEIMAGDYERCCSMWGKFSSNVIWLGTIPKEQIYSLILQAEASVLPSRVDNLPNTVLESLILGVPVIGSAGASIDELVETGVCGELVPIGDVEALAATMIKVWHRDVEWIGSGFRPPAVLDALKPERAADALLALAGSTAGG